LIPAPLSSANLSPLRSRRHTHTRRELSGVIFAYECRAWRGRRFAGDRSDDHSGGHAGVAQRVLRRRDETPEERYSHAVSHLRSRSRTRRVRNDGAVGSIWAAIFVPVNYLHGAATATAMATVATTAAAVAAAAVAAGEIDTGHDRPPQVCREGRSCRELGARRRDDRLATSAIS
jgi:hypothetical protein